MFKRLRCLAINLIASRGRGFGMMVRASKARPASSARNGGPSATDEVISATSEGATHDWQWSEEAIRARLSELRQKNTFFGIPTAFAITGGADSAELDALFNAACARNAPVAALRLIFNALRDSNALNAQHRASFLRAACRQCDSHVAVECWNDWCCSLGNSVARMPMYAINCMMELALESKSLHESSEYVTTCANGVASVAPRRVSSASSANDDKSFANVPTFLLPRAFSPVVAPWLALALIHRRTIDQVSLILLMRDREHSPHGIAQIEHLLNSFLDAARESSVVCADASLSRFFAFSAPSALFFHPLLTAYSLHGMCDRAFTLIERMRSLHVVPDAASWQHYCVALVRAGRIDAAINQIRHIAAQNLPRNAVLYHRVLNAVFAGSALESSVLSPAADNVGTDDIMIRRALPDHPVLSTSIINLLELMRLDGHVPHASCYSKLLLTVSKEASNSAERAAKIQDILAMMRGLAVTPDSRAYECAINAVLATAPDAVNALALIQSARSDGVTISSRSAVAVAQKMLASGDWNRTLAFVDELSPTQPTQITWALFHAAVRSRRYHSARALLLNLPRDKFESSFVSSMSQCVGQLLVDSSSRSLVRAFSEFLYSDSSAGIEICDSSEDAQLTLEAVDACGVTASIPLALSQLILALRLEDTPSVLSAFKMLLSANHLSLESVLEAKDCLSSDSSAQITSMVFAYALRDSVHFDAVSELVETCITSRFSLPISILAHLVQKLSIRSHQKQPALVQLLSDMLVAQLSNANPMQSTASFNNHLRGLCALQDVDGAHRLLLKTLLSDPKSPITSAMSAHADIVDPESVAIVLTARAGQMFHVSQPHRVSVHVACADWLALASRESHSVATTPLRSRLFDAWLGNVRVMYSDSRDLAYLLESRFPHLLNADSATALLAFVSQPPFLNLEAVETLGTQYIATSSVPSAQKFALVGFNYWLRAMILSSEYSDSDIYSFVGRMIARVTETTISVWCVSLLRRFRVDAAVAVASRSKSDFGVTSSGELFRSILLAVSRLQVARNSLLSPVDLNKKNDSRVDILSAHNRNLPNAADLEKLWTCMVQQHEVPWQACPWRELFTVLVQTPNTAPFLLRMWVQYLEGVIAHSELSPFCNWDRLPLLSAECVEDVATCLLASVSDAEVFSDFLQPLTVKRFRASSSFVDRWLSSREKSSDQTNHIVSAYLDSVGLAYDKYTL